MKSLILLLFALVFLVGLQSVVINRQDLLIANQAGYISELREYQSISLEAEKYWRERALK